MELKLDCLYVHKKTGKIYRIVSRCSMKSNGMWGSGICYRMLSPKRAGEDQLFVRHLSNFINAFTEYVP